jgi:hypothetical protein
MDSDTTIITTYAAKKKKSFYAIAETKGLEIFSLCGAERTES